jgi:K+-transporting ATPase KdpF subunit
MPDPYSSAPEISLLPGTVYNGNMSIELIIAGVLGVVILFYLVYSIIRPEKF